MSLEQMRDRMKEVLPEQEIPIFFEALQEQAAQPRKSIRFNPLKEGAQALWSQLSLPLLGPVPWFEGGFFIPREALELPEVRLFQAAGLGYVQEASAMEVAPALEVTASDRILDLCAAPGGKSTQLGESLRGAGWICSNEVDRDRVKLLDALLSRQGVARSTVFSLFPDALAERYPGAFNRILLDAPCSSESFFAKRSEKRQDVSHSEVRRCAKKQGKILRAASVLSAVGGKMVYSTCTYSRDENEAVVEAFLAENSDWTCLREVRRFPHRDGVPGGYFAILAHRGDSSPSSSEVSRPASEMNEFRIQGSWNGVVRTGLRRWDGSEDLYSRMMSSSVESLPMLDLELDDALMFCAGRIPPSLHGKKDPHAIRWKGFIIGGWDPERRFPLVVPRPLLSGVVP